LKFKEIKYNLQFHSEGINHVSNILSDTNKGSNCAVQLKSTEIGISTKEYQSRKTASVSYINCIKDINQTCHRFAGR
jgi:hypothetical protein